VPALHQVCNWPQSRPIQLSVLPWLTNARSRFKCHYQGICGHDSTSPAIRTSTPLTPDPNITSRPSTSKFDGFPSEFPAIYFLDFSLYQRSIAEVPRVFTAIPPELQAFTNDIREQAQVYFRTIHPWIPLLSKKWFNERLLSPFTPRSMDLTILFASIKLVCSLPSGDDMRTNAYITIKRSILDAEMAGVFSIRILQAWILVSVYELAHAIYPSAYLTIGACGRYAAALGLKLNDAIAQNQTFHWIEAEERTRALWLILILDR
jgi:hypothetical protein